MGGLEHLQSLVDEAAAVAAADPRLASQLAQVDYRAVKRGALAYLCRLADGDCRYEGPALAALGAAIGLDHDGFVALVDDLRRASVTTALPPDAASELLARIEGLEAKLVARP